MDLAKLCAGHPPRTLGAQLVDLASVTPSRPEISALWWPSFGATLRTHAPLCRAALESSPFGPATIYIETLTAACPYPPGRTYRSFP